MMQMAELNVRDALVEAVARYVACEGAAGHGAAREALIAAACAALPTAEEWAAVIGAGPDNDLMRLRLAMLGGVWIPGASGELEHVRIADVVRRALG